MEKLTLNIISLIATYNSWQHICISHKSLTTRAKGDGREKIGKGHGLCQSEDLDFVESCAC